MFSRGGLDWYLYMLIALAFVVLVAIVVWVCLCHGKVERPKGTLKPMVLVLELFFQTLWCYVGHILTVVHQCVRSHKQRKQHLSFAFFLFGPQNATNEFRS